MVQAEYGDIRKRIRQEPVWWDMNGVPRYGKFKPQDVPNVYARECVLLEVECAECGKRFRVEVDDGNFHHWPVLRALVEEGDIGYGPPPRHHCKGEQEESRAVKVVRFFIRNPEGIRWVRVHLLETEVRAHEVIGGSA